MEPPAITADITIEDLMQRLPAAVSYLREKGIRCLQCGEPIWGTLASAAREKGFGDADIEQFVNDLNALTNRPD